MKRLADLQVRIKRLQQLIDLGRGDIPIAGPILTAELYSVQTHLRRAPSVVLRSRPSVERQRHSPRVRT